MSKYIQIYLTVSARVEEYADDTYTERLNLHQRVSWVWLLTTSDDEAWVLEI